MEYGVTEERDVRYGTATGYWTEAPVGDRRDALRRLLRPGRPKPLPLQLDLYIPRGDDASGRPLLLMMHGGSFFVGHKQEPGQARWCAYFASLGYVAASIDYRLGFRPVRKDIRAAEIRALDDADAALAYLLGREDLRIDPRRVTVAGTSAGAITALNLAYRLYGDCPPEGLQPRLGRDFCVAAVVNLWGSVHDLSVLEHARVPILSFQSVADPVMPYDGGYPFRKAGRIAGLFSDYMYGTHAIHEKALSEGIRSEHHPCPEPRHRLHLEKDLSCSPRFYEIRDAIASFISGCRA